MEEKFISPRLLSDSRASSGVPCRHVSPRARIWEQLFVTFGPFCHVFFLSEQRARQRIAKGAFKIYQSRCPDSGRNTGSVPGS